MKCPKCKQTSGDDWSQCGGSCPMPMSPHFNVKPIVITQYRPLIKLIQGVEVYVDYDMAILVKPTRPDGLRVITGWWPDNVTFDPPIYIKAVDVSDYTQHGQGD